MQRAGLAGPCSLGVGALAQWEPGGVPMACSIPQSEQFSPSQTLDGGFLLQKKLQK